MFVSESPRKGSSRIANSCHSLFCLKSDIHEHSPNSQIHIQIFRTHRQWFSIDFLDHGEDGFHIVRCVRRYLEVVVPRRFRLLLTFPVN